MFELFLVIVVAFIVIGFTLLQINSIASSSCTENLRPEELERDTEYIKHIAKMRHLEQMCNDPHYRAVYALERACAEAAHEERKMAAYYRALNA